MNFDRPLLLWFALLVPLALAHGLWRNSRLCRSVSLLAGPRRREALVRGYRLAGGIGLAASCLFILAAVLALAGPSWGFRAVKTERSGLELAIVLDVSRSMDARDCAAGSRLDAAKASVVDLVREAPGASFSLTLAKGEGLLLVPMTEDIEALEDALDYADRESMTAPGTDLGKGILGGLESFSGRSSAARLLVLLSDGGDRGGSALAAAAEARRRKVRILALGFGGQEAMPIPGPDGAPLLDARGEAVRQALEPGLLVSLAAASGGRYLSAADSATEALLAEEILRAGRGGLRTEYEVGDRRALFIFIALGAFVLRALARLFAFAGDAGGFGKRRREGRNA